MKLIIVDIADELRLENGGNVLQNIAYCGHRAYEFRRRNSQATESREFRANKEDDECGGQS